MNRLTMNAADLRAGIPPVYGPLAFVDKDDNNNDHVDDTDID